MKRKIKVKRGQYGEITEMPKNIKSKANILLEKVSKAAKIDEHGGWNFGILDSNYNKGLIHTINYDFYGVGLDIHNESFLAVIQVREFYRRKTNRYPQIRKNYFLLGKNEDGRCFSHSINGNVIHAAIKKDRDVIKAVQDWIFKCDYSKALRQGDLCLLPVRAIKGDIIEAKELLLEDSHQLLADQIYKFKNEHYCINPQLIHLKNTHPSISGIGKYKVIIATRASFWGFAKPTLD